jgi:26S proteasome regulatory subunit T5
MLISNGVKLVHDAFELAKEKPPAIIFMEKLDTIRTCCVVTL